MLAMMMLMTLMMMVRWMYECQHTGCYHYAYDSWFSWLNCQSHCYHTRLQACTLAAVCPREVAWLLWDYGSFAVEGLGIWVCLTCSILWYVSTGAQKLNDMDVSGSASVFQRPPFKKP